MAQICKISTSLIAGSMGMNVAKIPSPPASEPAMLFLKNKTAALSLEQDSEVKKQLRKIEAGQQTFEGMFSSICEQDQTPCQNFVKNALKIQGDHFSYTDCSRDQFNNLLTGLEQDYYSTFAVEDQVVTADKNFVSSNFFIRLKCEERFEHEKDARLIDLNKLLLFVVENYAWPHITIFRGGPEEQTGNASQGTARGVPFSVGTWYSRTTNEDYKEGIGIQADKYEDYMNHNMRSFRRGNTTSEKWDMEKGIFRTDFGKQYKK